MAITYIDSKIASSTNASSVTTAAMNTTGASLLVVMGWVYSPGDAATMSDSASNTGWTQLTVTVGGNTEITGWYKENPTTSGTHTFTVNGSYPVIYAVAFSGTATSSTLDQQSAAYVTGFTTTVAPGSLTPAANNSVFVGFTGNQGVNYVSMNEGYSNIISANANPGTGGAGAGGYSIQTTATASNPTWTSSAPGADSGAISAIFKVAAGAAPSGHLKTTLLGVG